MERLKTLFIVLLVVFFASMYQGAILPFIDGITYGFSIVQYENETNKQTQEFILMDVVPNNQSTTIPNDVNLKNGQPVLVQSNNVSVITNAPDQKPVWLMALDALYMALTVIVLILGIWIPFLVISVFRSLQYAWVFERINLKRINRIGLLLVGIGLLVSVIQLINILLAQYSVQIAHYSFTYSKVIDFNTLLMGIVILIMNEVLRIAIALKEEQDLTI